MKKIILPYPQVNLILTRIAHQLVETHGNFSNTAILALQPRGTLFGKALADRLTSLFNIKSLYGEMDTTFHRDDFRRTDKPLIPNEVNIDFEIEGKRIILVDDVLYTGRSIRAALDTVNDYGRPSSIELVTLIDRKYNREVPIQPDYVGESIDTRADDYVHVEWEENKCKVWIKTDS